MDWKKAAHSSWRHLQHAHAAAKLLLIDLGGGSCELTLSEKGHIKEIVTLPLGAVRLTQEFIRHDPPTKPELKRLHDFIVQEAATSSRKITRAAVHAVIATSGTAAALAGAAQSLRLTRSGGVSKGRRGKAGQASGKNDGPAARCHQGNQSQARANHRGWCSGIRACA